MLVLLISGVCMIPCFKTGLPYGDDQQVHMLRVESILKALKSGQGYPVYIYQTMLEGYGYGMGIFYPVFVLAASRSLQTSGGITGDCNEDIYICTDDMYGTYCVLYRAEHWQKPLRGCCHYGALHNGTLSSLRMYIPDLHLAKLLPWYLFHWRFLLFTT